MHKNDWGMTDADGKPIEGMPESGVLDMREIGMEKVASPRNTKRSRHHTSPHARSLACTCARARA